MDENTILNLGDDTLTTFHVYMPDSNASRGYTLAIEPAPTPASELDTDGSNAAPDDEEP